ncbi:MAG: hypothetical protein QG608_3279 [Actinomycetota bacterium]|nr:hypothetical protein [Actinomycetota bacterium]
MGLAPDRRPHNAALICKARRRIDVLFALLRDRQPYQHPVIHEPAAAATAA